MSSSDNTDATTGVGPRFVRTTGLRSTIAENATGERSERTFDAPEASAEIRRLRTRVTELERELDGTSTVLERREARIEELRAELESVRRERDDARQWASFLDDELREHRAHVETLEERVEALESDGGGLLGRVRRLFG